MFFISKTFDLSNKFALPDTFFKAKSYCTSRNDLHWIKEKRLSEILDRPQPTQSGCNLRRQPGQQRGRTVDFYWGETGPLLLLSLKAFRGSMDRNPT